MQVQKIKCANCGTMFMSETPTNTCPACSEGHGQGSHEGVGGCGCGHSH
jgi:rubrerythrin